MIKGIAHNAIKVSDMEKSLHFYCDIAGLTKAFEIHDDNGKPWIVYLKCGDGQFIELFYDGVKDPNYRYAPDQIGYHHFCFEVNHIEEMAQRFYEHGLQDEPKASRGQDLNYNCWIHDPDGNAVEFVQYHSVSPHVKSRTGNALRMQADLNGIAHTAFVAEDMEKSLHFYCDILGFEKAFDLADDQNQPWLNYIKVKDDQFIELFYGGERRYPRHHDTAGFQHICFEVDDIFEIADHLEKNGVTLDVKPKRGKDHNYQCWAKDPDGTPIEFMQLDERSPQCNSYK